MEDILNNDLARLKFEDIIFIIFIVAISFNIVANQYQKNYVNTGNKKSEKTANDIYLFVLIVVLLIYLYFIYRNYDAYKKASVESKRLFRIKLLGSALLIAGVSCLIYFQTNNPDFVGAPSV